MTAVNGVNSVNFKAEQQQKQTSGVTFPLLGTAVGAAGYFVKKELGKDAFEKQIKDGTEVKYTEALSDSEQKLVEAAKKEANDTKTETPKAEDKKADTPKAEGEAKPVTNETPKSLVADKKLNEVFGKETEITPDKYLEKYGYGTTLDSVVAKEKEMQKSIAKTTNEIKRAKAHSLIVNDYAQKGKRILGLQRQVETIEIERDKQIADIETKAKAKVEALKYDATKAKIDEAANKALSSAETEEAKKLIEENRTKQIEALDAKLKTINSDAEKSVSSVKTQTAKKLNNLHQQSYNLNEAGEKLEEKIHIKDKSGKDFSLDFEPDEKKLNKFLKEKGYDEAGLTKLMEAEQKKYLDKELKKIKAANPGKVYGQEEIAQARTELLETTEYKNAMKKSMTKIKEDLEKLTNEEIYRQMDSYGTKMTELAKGKIVNRERYLAHQQAQLSEIRSDIELYKSAKANKSKITKAQAEGVLTSTAAKVKEIKAKITTEGAAKTAETALGKAFDAVKGKLAKTHSGMNALIGAGIGLAAGIVIKLMVDGSKSSEV